MGKSNMVEVIRSAGGTTTPATFPKLEERPDLMLSEDPPWAEDDCSRTTDQGYVSYWPENVTEKETENKFLDFPATV